MKGGSHVACKSTSKNFRVETMILSLLTGCEAGAFLSCHRSVAGYTLDKSLVNILGYCIVQTAYTMKIFG